MTRYLMAPAARRDLLEAVEDIAAVDLPAAARVQDAHFLAFEKLAERPRMGHVRSDLTTQAVRFWPVLGRYSVVYRIGDGDAVEIVRVLGPKRDSAALLG